MNKKTSNYYKKFLVMLMVNFKITNYLLKIMVQQLKTKIKFHEMIFKLKVQIIWINNLINHLYLKLWDSTSQIQMRTGKGLKVIQTLQPVFMDQSLAVILNLKKIQNREGQKVRCLKNQLLREVKKVIKLAKVLKVKKMNQNLWIKVMIMDIN